jgi:hypothetical protein
LQNSGGTPQLQWGAGGGNNLSVDVAININPANAAVNISPTGTGTVAISPAGASTMNNVAIGGTTPLTGAFTTVKASTTVGVGNATPAASGAGITFPATQSASSDVNTLDDYEKGAWSPSIGGNATYTSQIGQYVKIGNVVTCTFLIAINAIGTGSATTLSGFPFTSVNAGIVQSGNVSYYGSIATSVTSLHFYVNNNNTTALFTGNVLAASTIGNAINVFRNSAAVYGSITYITN